ncbi:unnamed protein product [Effrenium voratum]|nr:unnamed protein product [Effrenium voratum]
METDTGLSGKSSVGKEAWSFAAGTCGDHEIGGLIPAPAECHGLEWIRGSGPAASRAMRPGRGKRKKPKREPAEGAEVPDAPRSLFFLSHAWLASPKPVLAIGLVLVNLVLLSRNAGLLAEVQPAPQVPRLRRPAPQSVVPGPAAPPPLSPSARPASTSAAQTGVVAKPAGDEDASGLIAEALRRNGSHVVRFLSPAWRLPLAMLAKGQQRPYEDKFQEVNLTHGQYQAHENVVFVSACSAHEIHKTDIPFEDFLQEKAAYMRMACPAERAAQNVESKRVVIYMNLRESGYFGHAMDNVLPRVAAIMDGVLKGHSLSLVLPPLGKRSMSANTQLLGRALGIEVLQQVPSAPHRTLGLSGVAPWSASARRWLQRRIRQSPLLAEAQPAVCQAPPGCACGSGGSGGIFVGRKGSRNSRPLPGAELLEAAFARRGFRIVSDASALPLAELAKALYGTCRLAGFSGTGMLNMIFLPPQASVVELNPHMVYANSWLWAHTLGYCYCQAGGALRSTRLSSFKRFPIEEAEGRATR